MSIPSKITGGGNSSVAQNVLRITFSQALAAPPRLEGWDDSTFATVAKEMFAGTTVNGSKPMVSAVATTDGAPSSNWKPASATAGGDTVNRLKGTSSYVILSTGNPGVGGVVRWNMDWEIPSDATVPATNSMNGVFAVRYSYSGSAPSLTWAYNEGSEGSPSWTTITPGSAGNLIRPADSGVSSSAVVLTKPISGVVDAAELWITAT